MQQRPYIINPNYIVKHTNNGDWIGYNAQAPVIRATIKTVDNIKTSEDLNRAKEHGELAGKILLARNAGWDSFAILAYSEDLKSVLNIDTCYRLQHELYGHCGNEWRERGTPFLSTQRASDFANVHDGDIMEIDMRTAQFKILPQKTR